MYLANKKILLKMINCLSAKGVIKLHQSFDHPSNRILIYASNNGNILGIRLTEQDVVRSEHMFG